MNRKIGFDVMQVLLKAESVEELDEAIRVVNCSYPVLRDQLCTFDEIKEFNMLGLRVGFVRIGYRLDGSKKN